MSRAKLADRAGVSKHYVYELETGQKRPGVDVALRLCDALETTVEELFTRSSEALSLGTRVRAARSFPGVPADTLGVVDEVYESGVMVAWDLPDRPLPEGYREWDGRPAIARGAPLRDGFSWEEIEAGLLHPDR